MHGLSTNPQTQHMHGPSNGSKTEKLPNDQACQVLLHAAAALLGKKVISDLLLLVALNQAKKPPLLARSAAAPPAASGRWGFLGVSITGYWIQSPFQANFLPPEIKSQPPQIKSKTLDPKSPSLPILKIQETSQVLRSPLS